MQPPGVAWQGPTPGAFPARRPHANHSAAWRKSLLHCNAPGGHRRPFAAAPAAAGSTDAGAESGRQSHVSLLPVFRSASASELLRLLEERLDAGTDDEQLAVAALQCASLRRQDPHFFYSPAALDSLLPVLERLLRRNVVAFTPAQLGAVTRCYVLLGGASPVVLGALQEEACNWVAEDYSLRALAELVWSLAWAKRVPTPAFIAHLGAIVQAQQQDWGHWFGQAKAGRLVMVLWGLASLQCQPCEGFLEAACQRLQQVSLTGVTSKSLATLLWALARLQASDPQAAEALSLELCARMELQLSDEGPAMVPAAAVSQDAAGQGAVAGVAAAAVARQSSSGSGWEGGQLGEDEGEDAAEAGWYTQGSSLSEQAGRQGWAGGGVEASVSVAGDDSQHWAGEHFGGAGGASEAAPSRTDAVGRWDSDLSPTLLSTLVWAWGKLKYRHSAGLRMATLLLHGGVRELAPADMSRVLWGLAHLEYGQSQLLGALCGHLMQPGVLSSFSIPQIATMMYAFSSMDYFPGEPILAAIAECCLALRDSFDPRSLCHVLWSLARLGYEDKGFYTEFVPVVLADIGQYSTAELADLSRVYAKFSMAPEGLFEAIAEQTVASMQGADIQDLLRILTAFNQLGLQPDALLSAVEGWANQRLRQLSPQALTLALGTFARLGGPRSPSLMAAAAECVAGQLPAFEPAQLALVVWSFAKLGYTASGVLDHAVRLLVDQTARFSDKAVSNVLWAMATVDHPLPHRQQALDRIAGSIQGRLNAFGAQSLSNIAWAYATLGHAPSPQFLKRLGDAANGRLLAFEPQGLALLVWALGTWGYRHDPLLRSIDASCSRGCRLRRFEGQHLSNLLWGMAKVGFRPRPAFWQRCAREAAALLPDLRPQEIFNIAWAYATMRLHPPQLIAALAAEAARRPFALSPQELSGMLWALARLGHGGSEGAAQLLAASEGELERRGAELEDRHLAVMVWAWGELQHRPTPHAMAAVWRQVEERAATCGTQPLCTLAKGFAALRSPPKPPLAAALTSRALRLAPSLKPFECAELLESLLALGLREEAQQLLHHLATTSSSGSSHAHPGQHGAGAPAPDEPLPARQPASHAGSRSIAESAAAPRSRTLLEGVVAAAPLPSVVRLLGAMAQLGAYPEPGFTQVRRRLAAASPKYRFSQRDLAHLGAALAQLDEEHRGRIKLHSAVLRRVQESMAAGAEGLLRNPLRAGVSEISAGGEGGDASGDGGTAVATRHPHAWFPPE